MTRALAIAALLVAGACSNPPLSIQFELRGGPDGTCPSTACADIPMACDTMLFVRVVDPAHPDQFLESTCSQITPDGRGDLCSIAGVQLAPPTGGELPAKTLEVQVAVLPLKTDADGNLDCASATANLKFDATGQPIMTADSPPIAGRAYYHAGDAVTTVELGCNDLGPINDGCATAMTVSVQPTVNDFANVNVSSAVGDTLTVSAGEPQPVLNSFELTASDKTVLDRTVEGPVPLWGGDVRTPVSSMCVEVLADGPMQTASLRCVPAEPGAKMYSFAGIQLPQATLSKIIQAIPNPCTGPNTPAGCFSLDNGLVVGVVLNEINELVPGITVESSSGATIKYLTTGTPPTLDGTATTENGVFVSTDAGFNTTWHAQKNATTTATGFGGRVDGVVTVVILQFPSNPNN